MRENLEQVNHSEKQQEIKEKEREISIIIIDDHKNFPNALAANIKTYFSDQKFYIQTSHEYSSEIAEFILHHGIDIILLDVNLGAENYRWSSGDRVSKDLRKRGFIGKIIFFDSRKYG